MPDSRDESPKSDYFNDLSQQPANGADGPNERQALKAKRCSACTLCRKRKLKCDGARPACSTCSRLQHVCSYDEVRKKSGMRRGIAKCEVRVLIVAQCIGPKRGYVKLLEARLAQVETLLKTQGDQPMVNRLDTSGNMSNSQSKCPGPANVDQPTLPQPDLLPQALHASSLLPSDIPSDFNATAEETHPWDMISLGLDEPLPIQPVVDELNQIFFEKVHPS